MDDDLPSGLGPEEFSARVFGAGEPYDGGAGLELAPFRGVHFAPEVVGDLSAVTTPPYDLIDDDAVSRLLESDAHNIVRLILPARDAKDTEAPYVRAGETLRRWLAEGILVTDAEPALYVYEESDAHSLQRGLIGAVGLRPEAARVVLPHENVFPGPVRDRLRLMSATEANLEPIFLVYDGGGATSRIVDEVAAEAEPVLEVISDDGVEHRLWRITDPDLHAWIADDLRPRQALIADGHHRYATYRALQARHQADGDGAGPWDHGLALLVDSSRYPPRLGAIHRVLPGLAPDLAVKRARSVCRVSEPAQSLPAALEALRAVDGPAFLLGGGDRLHLLSDPDPRQLSLVMPANRSARWQHLDTAILDLLLIENVWDVTADDRSVEVVHHDAAAAIERARRTGGTAVILNPLRVEDVLAVAADGERVPRKSTSFGPKPRTGLVLRLLGP
ncbi:DUF1015 family protein [Actinomadura scrupuli]|uniref:DUF1015 family protein n=1 Tax=Actinomadura scrupuli TaxID=559629 RepID=UPI003D98BF9D